MDCECGTVCRARILVFRADELDETPYELTDVISTSCQQAGEDLQYVEDGLFHERLFTAELWAVDDDGPLEWAATDAHLCFWPSVDDYTLHGLPRTPDGERMRKASMALELERVRPTLIKPENL